MHCGCQPCAPWRRMTPPTSERGQRGGVGVMHCGCQPCAPWRRMTPPTSERPLVLR